MKAMVYIIDVHCRGTQETILRDEQLERIHDFAERNKLEIVDYIIDEGSSLDNYENRPGYQELINRMDEYDIVLIERVWVFSRSAKDLKPLMDLFHQNDKGIIAATQMWDCVSQVIRRSFKNTEKAIKGVPTTPNAQAKPSTKSAPKHKKSWFKKIFSHAA